MRQCCHEIKTWLHRNNTTHQQHVSTYTYKAGNVQIKMWWAYNWWRATHRRLQHLYLPMWVLLNDIINEWNTHTHKTKVTYRRWAGRWGTHDPRKSNDISGRIYIYIRIHEIQVWNKKWWQNIQESKGGLDKKLITGAGGPAMLSL